MSENSYSFPVVVLIVVLGIGSLILLCWLTKVSWNHVMPDLFGLPTITFDQAVWLQVLSLVLIRPLSGWVK